MLATKLSSALVAPSKVANILDWRKAVGSVMALDISRDRIGIAVAEHPEMVGEAMPLNPISLVRQDMKRSRVEKELISELEAAVRQHRVCAFVVNWPVNEGRMGEQCGKVLHVLDYVMDQSNSVVTRKRPFTLWCNSADASAFDASPPDEWGRSAVFARAPAYLPGMEKNAVSYSSKSALDGSSSQSSSAVAAGVLDEWIKNHWDVDVKMGTATTAPKKAHSDFFFSTHSVDEYNSEKAFLQAALL